MRLFDCIVYLSSISLLAIKFSDAFTSFYVFVVDGSSYCICLHISSY